MTIDEKITQYDHDKLFLAYEECRSDNTAHMRKIIELQNENEKLKSEMLADMQKLVEALEFYQKHADCNSGVICGNCRCSFCKRDEKFKRTFSEFNAKYKGGK